MSSTASNYEISKLVGAQVIAALCLLSAVVVAFPTVAAALRTSLPFIAIALSYGGMMFASSYVEEEHHFWYWATTAWLLLLWIKWYVYVYASQLEPNLRIISKRKQTFKFRLVDVSAILLLATTRVVRRWNQTGQKFAGESDIVKSFFSDHRHFFWCLVAITYLWNLQALASISFPRFPQVVAGAVAAILATAAVTFKLAFTMEDSPELLVGLAESMADSEMGISLVTHARIVFIAIGLTLAYTLASSFSHKRPNRKLHFLRCHTTILIMTSNYAHYTQSLDPLPHHSI